MDRHASELHHSNWRMGKVLRDGGVKVFQVETTVNNDTFGTTALDTASPLSMLQKREWEWTAKDRAAFMAVQAGLKRMPARAKRAAFHSWRSEEHTSELQSLMRISYAVFC